MGTKYVRTAHEDVFEVPVRKVYRLGCCDCGLVHDVVWVILRGERRLIMAARRNERATAQKRRHLKAKKVGRGHRDPGGAAGGQPAASVQVVPQGLEYQ